MAAPSVIGADSVRAQGHATISTAVATLALRAASGHQAIARYCQANRARREPRTESCGDLGQPARLGFRKDRVIPQAGEMAMRNLAQHFEPQDVGCRSSSGAHHLTV